MMLTIIKDVIVGTPEMGGPIEYYYIGDMDVKFDTIAEDEQNKEPFFNFVFEAENFMDAKSKENWRNI